MYVGHVGIALGARSLRRDIPLWLLVLAAQGCDWLDVLFGQLMRVEDKSLWTHSIPSVALAAVAVGIVARLLMRSSTAALFVAAVYVSHILADYVTGYKPLFLDGRVFGLGLYGRPAIDFAIEGSIIAAGWWLYRRSAAPARRSDPALGALLVTLLTLQLVADTVFAIRGVLRTERGLPDGIALVADAARVDCGEATAASKDRACWSPGPSCGYSTASGLAAGTTRSGCRGSRTWPGSATSPNDKGGGR